MIPLPSFWRRHFLVVELALGTFLTCTFVLWTEKWGGWPVIAELLKDRRGTIYGVLASILGSLLGFAIAAESVVLSVSQHDKLAVIRESKFYPMLWKVFVSTIRFLGFATLSALVALLIDRDASPVRFAVYLVFFVLCMTLFRVARCIWVLENIVGLIAASKKGPGA